MCFHDIYCAFYVRIYQKFEIIYFDLVIEMLLNFIKYLILEYLNAKEPHSIVNKLTDLQPWN